MNNETITILYTETDLTMLRGIMACAAKNDVRYYLNGFHITMQHTEATDGRRAARFPTPQQANGNDVPGSLNTIIPVIKILAGTANLYIDIDPGGKITVDQTTKRGDKTTQIYQEIDAKYVDMDRVMPSFKNPTEHSELHVNPCLAADIVKAAKTLYCPTRFVFGVSIHDAYKFEIQDIPHLEIVIMPIRWGS